MAIIPTIRCSYMRRSVAFYTDIHRLRDHRQRRRSRRPGFLRAVARRRPDRTVEPPRDGLYRQAIVIETEDVDGVFRDLRARGLRTPGNPAAPGHVHEAPIDQSWDSREFYVDDPDGNTLRFVQW